MIIAYIYKIDTNQDLESCAIFPRLIVLYMLLCHISEDHRPMSSEHNQVPHYVTLEHTMGIDLLLFWSYHFYKNK